MHYIHPMQIDHSLYNLPSKFLKGREVSQFLVWKTIDIFLRVTSWHKLQNDCILLLFRLILPSDEVQVLDDSGMIKLSADFKLFKHRGKN